MTIPTEPIIRFEQRIKRDDSGCWLWLGAVNAPGYGTFNPRTATKVYAHRWAYEHWVGPIPSHLELDHLCHVRRCVNPEHLEPVTRAENQRRTRTALATHCDRGHPYDAENTYRRPDIGTRLCRTCRRLRRAEVAAATRNNGDKEHP